MARPRLPRATDFAKLQGGALNKALSENIRDVRAGTMNLDSRILALESSTADVVVPDIADLEARVDALETLPLLHDTTHSPVSLWQLNNALTDSGTAGETLTLETGTLRWGEAQQAGAFALYCDGATRLVGSATAPGSLIILGDVTVELLCYPTGVNAAIASLVQCAGDASSETSPNNPAWMSRLAVNAAPEFHWEDGAGANNFTTATGFVLTPGQWHHVAMTRDTSGGVGATTGRVYVDGELVATQTGLNPPTDASASRIRIGGDNIAGRFFTGYISSPKVIASLLTGAQILAEARRTLWRHQLWGG